jgi:hypothetical protein
VPGTSIRGIQCSSLSNTRFRRKRDLLWRRAIKQNVQAPAKGPNPDGSCFHTLIPQIVKEQAVVKVFLIPYDHTLMPHDSRVVSRQKTYARGSFSPKDAKQRLVSAVHMQYIRHGSKLYLAERLRLVFSGTRAAAGLSTVDSFELDTSFKYVPLEDKRIRKGGEELSLALDSMTVNR